MIDSLTYYIYGLCTMFYSMMAWMFWRKGGDMLSRLFSILMIITCAESFKDLFIYIENKNIVNEGLWNELTAMDMVVIPIYNFILKELVKPGWLTWKKIILHETVFIVLIAGLFISNAPIWFHCLVGWGAIYGLGTLVVTLMLISDYHRQLKDRFSYQENINLNWLRGVLFSFFFILIVWTIASLRRTAYADNLYMVCSLALWMVLSYFLYRHESVIDELVDTETIDEPQDKSDMEQSTIATIVQRLFYQEQIYLNPKLKLSDVATLVGTNRTYLSRYFNQENGKTFYDFVNKLRISHAEHLLRTTSDSLAIVAEKSGFNSQSTFRRVFACYHDCSPIEYRKIHTSP